jgi:hypothetical protein
MPCRNLSSPRSRKPAGFHLELLQRIRKRHRNLRSVVAVVVHCPDQTVKLVDSSPDGTSRIQVEFEKGQFVKAEPFTTIVFIGGG